MAKLYVTGTAITLKSALKMVDLKRLEKLHPEALEIKDEKGDQIFKLSVGKKDGSFNKYGVTFAKKDRSGKAMVTMAGEVNYEEMSKDEIAEMHLPVLAKLQELEDFISEYVLPSLSREIDNAANTVVFVGADAEAETAPEMEDAPETAVPTQE